MDKDIQRTAWSVLPKEFKEEVKKEWQHSDGGSYAEEMLENIFGYDNLTSGAEGEEDEMLVASRNRLMDAFSSAKIIATSKMSSKMLAGAADMCIKTFEDLFGSKCLPDEVKPTESGGFNEPKPAEPKFKVGDKVKVHKISNPYNGAVGEIIDINVDESCFVLFPRNQAWFRPSDLESYTEQTCTQTCTDDCASQDQFRDPTKMIDNIINDGFRDHNRLNVATHIAAAIVSRGKGYDAQEIAVTALEVADALIKEALKGESDGED